MRNVSFFVISLLALSSPSWCQTPLAENAQGGSSDASAKVALTRAHGLPHAFDIDVAAPRPVETVSVRVDDGAKTWGRFSALISPPEAETGIQTASFRFFPARYTVSVRLDYEGGGSETRQFGPYSNTIQKFIMVERDIYPQHVVLVEGDSWLLFGRIADISKVSTGKEESGHTALGYYHVRSKEAFAVNQKQEWDMPYVHWYTPPTYPEGVNGMHQGFAGTNYGIPQSHGCTRLPEEFAKRMFAWSDIDVPLINMGDRFLSGYDRGRFIPGDARIFRLFQEDMFAYQEALQGNDEAPTCLSAAEAELVTRMKGYQDGVLECCAQYRRFAHGEAYYALARQYGELRGLDTARIEGK